MNADQQTTSEVKATLSRFHDAFRKRDMDSLTAVLAPDPDVTLFGTGPDEERVGVSAIREQMQRDWRQSESASIDLGPLHVSNRGSVAWVAGDVTITAKVEGAELKAPGRITAVMDKRDGHWLIDQWHLSVPMAGQEEGQSFPTRKGA